MVRLRHYRVCIHNCASAWQEKRGVHKLICDLRALPATAEGAAQRPPPAPPHSAALSPPYEHFWVTFFGMADVAIPGVYVAPCATVAKTRLLSSACCCRK